MSAPIDITGQRFGKLVALRPVKRPGLRGTYWECECDCGNVTCVRTSHLTAGEIVSCGCHRKERFRTHGYSHTEKLYIVWSSMKRRCLKPNEKSYKDYGGRGISVCEEWLYDYVAFREWALKNGYSRGKEIHRIDKDRGYSPKNCVWMEQSEHRRLHRLEHPGRLGTQHKKK